MTDHAAGPGAHVSGPAGLSGPRWLTEVDALGGFFAVRGLPADEVLGAAAGLGLIPWSEALAPEAFRARVASVRERLAAGAGLDVAEVDLRMAVSATQVGLASRLWSVALAAAVLHGIVPELSSGTLLLSREHGGAVPLGWCPGEAATPEHVQDAGVDDLAAALDERVVRRGLADLVRAGRAVGPTPARVLESNSASALVGGARVLARLRPNRAERAWALAHRVLALPSVAAGGAVEPSAGLPAGVGGPTGRADEAFMRTGCCLFYRLPEHGLCPDCVIARRKPAGVTPGH